MLLLLPCGLIAAQEGEQTAAAEFGSCGLDQDGAAAPRANDGVDLLIALAEGRCVLFVIP